jgi:electron transfer flavoprotein beta subunit
MNIVVPVKMVPDLVDELLIDPDGKSLDVTWMRQKLNEFDDHAIEQAILLKELHNAKVSVIVPDQDGADDVLYMASAKGADELIKLAGVPEYGMSNHELARGLAPVISSREPDLVLTGVQAHDDLDGSLGALLAQVLELPYLGYIAGVDLDEGNALVKKEFPGGVGAQMSLEMPGVLGIQASESPPRYVAFSRIRQAMSTTQIEEILMEAVDPCGSIPVSRMYLPETAAHAEMLSGSPEEVAEKLVDLFLEHGIL